MIQSNVSIFSLHQIFSSPHGELYIIILKNILLPVIVGMFVQCKTGKLTSTGDKQGVTGCGSQRRQCSSYSTKTHVNSMIHILKKNWLCWETYTFKVVFVEHLTHFNVYVSQRSQIQFEDEDHAVYISFRWVTTTCLPWEPQPVTLWLYRVTRCDRKYNLTVQGYTILVLWRRIYFLKTFKTLELWKYQISWPHTRLTEIIVCEF